MFFHTSNHIYFVTDFHLSYFLYIDWKTASLERMADKEDVIRKMKNDLISMEKRIKISNDEYQHRLKKKDLELESAKRTIQILGTTLAFTEFNLKMKEEILRMKKEDGKGHDGTQPSKNEVPSSKRKCDEAEKRDTGIEVITID